MNLGRSHGSTRRASSGGGRGSRPRVVILDDGASARVEVLELPETAAPGAKFCHSGASWRVTGTRTGARVLIAKPIES